MKTFPAKLLLFGEHTVNLGSQALAVPLPLFSGRWKYAPQFDKEELTKRQMQLPQFADYLEALQQRGESLLKIEVAAFRQALSEGLIFQSDIPRGYGVGSSGALVAAVLNDFGWTNDDLRLEKSTELLRLKKGLAQMESFFHGTSSGTDPLICFLQKPVLLEKEGVKIVQLPGRWPLTPEGEPNWPPTREVASVDSPFGVRGLTLFLLDTGIERQATPLIEYFLEKWQEEEFKYFTRTRLLPVVELAIGYFLKGDKLLFNAMHAIGEFQLEFLEKMIPPAFQSIWREGLESDSFKLKVCGAGGGGFLLGIAKDLEEMRKKYLQFNFLPVKF